MHVKCLTAEGSVFLYRSLLTGFRPEQNKDRTMTGGRGGYSSPVFAVQTLINRDKTSDINLCMQSGPVSVHNPVLKKNKDGVYFREHCQHETSLCTEYLNTVHYYLELI